MVWLWGEFIKYYGTKAEQKLGLIGENMFIAWANELQQFSLDDIAKTVEHCVNGRDESWPPELQEFVHLCIANKPAPCHKPYKSRKLLPHLKSTKEFAGKFRDDIKKILG